MNICPVLHVLQKDCTRGDVCNESNRIKASCGLRSLKSLGGLQKLPVWHLALCILCSAQRVITPLPGKESHGCAGQCLAHPPGPVSTMNPLGFCRGQCQQLGSFAEKQAFLALNFNYRRNVSLDCQWFLISDERLHMSPLSNV